jgi:CheY-like chemotaxis protein
MKVLIVDDEPISRRLLQNYLEKWGYEVVVAENGARAWEVFQRTELHMVISDWLMPEMDGLELVRRIRARSNAEYVYTILVTVRAQKEDLVEAMEAGADDFISKPFDRDELRVRLREGERFVQLEQKLIEQSRRLIQVEQRLAEFGGAEAVDSADTLRERLRGPVAQLQSRLAALDDVLSGLRRTGWELRQRGEQWSPAAPQLSEEIRRMAGGLERALDEIVACHQQAREINDVLGTPSPRPKDEAGADKTS